MSLTSASLLTSKPTSSHPSPLPRLQPILRTNEHVPESKLLSLPLELRLQIYSHLLPTTYTYSTGIYEPGLPPQRTLRHDLTPSHPSLLLTCKRIHLEAIPLLYHHHSFNFDVAGHLLRSPLNRYNLITSVNFRAWLALSSFFKQQQHSHMADGGLDHLLDWRRVEEVCVTFWPTHGCGVKLGDARMVTERLCGQLGKAERLRRVRIVFRDGWPGPRATATGVTGRAMTEVEMLVQGFRVLRGVEEVSIEGRVYRTVGEGSQSKVEGLGAGGEEDRLMDSQLRCLEEAKAVMMRPVDGILLKVR